MISRNPQESEKKKHSTDKDYRTVLTRRQMKTEEGLDGNIYLISTEYICICWVGSATDWDDQWVEVPLTGMGSGWKGHQQGCVVGGCAIDRDGQWVEVPLTGMDSLWKCHRQGWAVCRSATDRDGQWVKVPSTGMGSG